MMKTKLISASAALLLGAVSLSAQGIDQNVEVTNEYETRFSDFQKRGPEGTVPDSVYRFDYSFDYSVFDSPYKGAYDFTPYEIKLTPEPVPYDGRLLYMRAGAGYSLHPVLELSYSPLSGENVGLSLFNSGSGYAGDSFHDLSDRAGVSGHYRSRVGQFSFSAGYGGIFAGDGIINSSYNSASLSLRLSSPKREGLALLYDLGMDYRYGADHITSQGKTGEHLFGVSGSCGPAINEFYSLLIDFNFLISALREDRSGFAGRAMGFGAVTPHLRFVAGPADVDAGVRLDYLAGDSGSYSIAPHLKASLEVSSLDLKAFAGIGGGRRLNSYYDLKRFNHFYRRQTGPEASRDKIDFYGGVQGRIGVSFQYDLKGGYALRSDSPLDSPSAGLGFADYREAYAELKMLWLSERLNADADVRFSNAEFDSLSEVYAPAAFSGDFRLTYNWMKRIYAGITADGASSRHSALSSLSDLRGYLDLGLYGEYRLDSMWSAWLHAGNLACMKIERHPGYVEKGPYFTLGLCLSL